MNNIDKLFHGKSGNVFIFGIVLILILIFSIIISHQVDTEFAHKITGIVFSNLFVGRVPALSFGYAAGLSHFTVIGVNVLTELILVSILYPLFVLSVEGIVKVKMLEEFFTSVQQKKKKHQVKFDKYGKFGLFIFVFIPFWMTGPIVGAMIGYLIGIKHYTTISIVIIATTIAITLWGLFLQEIIDFLMTFDTQLVWIGFGVFILIILAYRFRHLLKKFYM